MYVCVCVYKKRACNMFAVLKEKKKEREKIKGVQSIGQRV